MALVINDRVKETSTTTGTGTFSLAGAATGFDTFVAGIATGNTTYYAIFNQGTTEWEVGLGTVTDATPDTLARTTVLTNSDGNTLSGNAVAYGTAVASCDFDDTSWTTATFAAAFGAIYNDSQSDKLCVVLDFDGSKSCTNGTFTISFPSPSTAADAIISMA